MKKIAEQLGIAVWAAWMWLLLILILISGLIIRAAFVTFVDNHEIGYQYDQITGEVKVLDRTGYFWVIPFKTVIHTIDGRPMQVRIEANNRVLNAKLLRFRRNSEGVAQFIQMHGRKDYDDTNLPDILKSYAYENYGENSYDKEYLERKYKFLEILSYGTNSTGGVILEEVQDSLNSK